MVPSIGQNPRQDIEKRAVKIFALDNLIREGLGGDLPGKSRRKKEGRAGTRELGSSQLVAWRALQQRG